MIVAETLTKGGDRSGKRGYSGRRREDDVNLVAATLNCGDGNGGFRTEPGEHLIAHTLRADGFDASEDGTGRGTPLVPVAYRTSPNCGAWETGDRVDSLTTGTDRTSHLLAYQCHGGDVGPMGTIRSGHGDVQSGVAFVVNAAESNARQSHARVAEVARCIDRDGSFASNQGGTVVAYNVVGTAQQGRNHAIEVDVSGCLQHKGLKPKGNEGGTIIAIAETGKRTGVSATDIKAGDGFAEPGDPMFTIGADSRHGVGTGSGVRRLTPLECERLQGFPDDWALVPIKPVPAKSQAKARARAEAGDERFAEIGGVVHIMAADGARYRAIGNSFAVPVVRWIGHRIDMVERLAGQSD